MLSASWAVRYRTSRATGSWPCSARLPAHTRLTTRSTSVRTPGSFRPYLAVTWRVTQRWEISSRLTYDWSSRNNNPSPAYGAADIQAGDQMEINMSASYAVSDNWRLGVSGYALRQLGDARIDGSPVPGSAVHLVGTIIRIS